MTIANEKGGRYVRPRGKDKVLRLRVQKAIEELQALNAAIASEQYEVIAGDGVDWYESTEYDTLWVVEHALTAAGTALGVIQTIRDGRHDNGAA